MKKLTMTLLATVLLAGMMSAQQEPAKTQQPTPPMRGMGMGMGMMHGQMGPAGAPMGLPNLTAEQRTKMQDLRLAHQKEMLPVHSQLQKLQADLKLEMVADKPNDSKVKSLQGDIAKLTSEIGAKQFAHMRSMREILTPEQRKAFDERILSGNMGPGKGRGPGAMMGPQGNGRGKMGQGHMGGRGGMMRGRGMMGGPNRGPAACPNCPMK